MNGETEEDPLRDTDTAPGGGDGQVGMSIVFDLFCGAGGASTGLCQAATSIGRPITEMVAVNHWAKAVATHKRNHPWANVLHEDVSRVDPRPIFRGKKVKLGVAGPSCVHFSSARGGKPVSDQERSHAWDVVRWARICEPENLIVENVPEFAFWGPLGEDGKPDKHRRGEYFQEFLQALRRLGYNVDYRILCAAHYGDATTRRRLFVQARRGPISWPQPSHRMAGEGDLFGLPLARSAREIIDWNLPGESIWTRKKPLAEATMARIMEGLRRYVGGPFIVPQLSGARPRGVDEPLNTITATGSGNALVQPFLVGIGGPRGRQVPSSLDSPLGTIIGQNHTYLVEPFLIPNFGERAGQAPRTHSVDEPLPTITGHGAGVLIEPFLLRYNDGRRVQSIDEPVTTLDGSNRFAVVEPFLVSYYGTGHPHSLADALPTITGKDRFALVEAIGSAMEQGVTLVADIRLRMLQPHELAAAHSFPADYEFCGGKMDAVKMVGNSWPVATAQALCREVLA